GTLGGALVNNGVLMPGALPGVALAGVRQAATASTLTVAGNFTQGAGGQLVSAIGPAGSHSLLLGGGTLKVVAVGTSGFTTGSFAILTAAQATDARRRPMGSSGARFGAASTGQYLACCQPEADVT